MSSDVALRVCTEPGCPALVKAGRCSTHTRAKDKARGSRQERGYDREHELARERYQRRIDKGERIKCATCPTILAGRDWDLGHTEDRRGYLGPQCITCNRGHHEPD